MKKFTAAILALALAMCLCACGGGGTTTASDMEPSAIAETAEAAAVPAEGEAGEAGEFDTPWPEDTGGLSGVYKWVEMEDIGVRANLILWDDGVGVFDMLGVVETVMYDEDTMQTSGEGALPQKYTYADSTLTWTAVDKDGETVSTFVKLTEEELAEYQTRGIGNAE